MLAPHPLSIFALNTAEITDIAAAIRIGVGVNDLAVKPGARNAESIIVTHDRCRVDDEHNQLAFARFSHKRNDTVVRVVKIDPLESVVRIVLLPERRLAFVNVIQMLDQTPQTVVFRKIEKVPVEARVVVPFAPLTEFAAHEK